MCWLDVSMLPTAGVQIGRARDESILNTVTRDFHIYTPICPECTRLRGRQTRPPFQRIDGFRAREHCKDQIAVSASDREHLGDRMKRGVLEELLAGALHPDVRSLADAMVKLCY